MIVQIADVLPQAELNEARRLLEGAGWIDGSITAGHQAKRVKNNQQIPEDHPVAVRIGQVLVAALHGNPLFVSAALPAQIFPPLFNRYEGGQAFGAHIDNAIRISTVNGVRVRTDLSATLFLVDPSEYDGGELMIEDTFGVHSVKLPAGHLVLYPASSLHYVRPVTRGARLASFFWIQSLVRDDGARTLLFDLDTAIQQLSSDRPDHPAISQLTGVYHNLLRRWAET